MGKVQVNNQGILPSGEALPRLCFNRSSGHGISSVLWQNTKATNSQLAPID